VNRRDAKHDDTMSTMREPVVSAPQAPGRSVCLFSGEPFTEDELLFNATACLLIF